MPHNLWISLSCNFPANGNATYLGRHYSFRDDGLDGSIGTGIAALNPRQSSPRFPVPVRAQSMQIEPSTSARKNLLIPTGLDYELSATQIVALDALSGAQVWRSPKLRGQLSDKGVRRVGRTCQPAR